MYIDWRSNILCALLSAASVVSSPIEDWHPIHGPGPVTTYHGNFFKTNNRLLDTSQSLKIINKAPIHTSSSNLNSLSNIGSSEGDTCSVYKVSMNQELPYQYVEYEKEFPDMKEFTICLWKKFHNHTEDHPLFSYAVPPNNPKAISLWISNTAEASYYSMAVAGHTFFRLNYPIKLNTWYHSCQSWNGKTGEWQIWVNGERVGRGFYNRLVGHVIKGGGVAVSGQEQSMLYYSKNNKDLKAQSGLKGEITMLQLYHVALTAGKAHKDHKHHHVHHFKHDGTPIDGTTTTTQAPTELPPPEPIPIGNGAFYIGNQLQRPSKINLAGQQPQPVEAQLPNGLQIQQQYINGQLGNTIISEQLLSGVSKPQFGPATSQISGASDVPVSPFQITKLYTPARSSSPKFIPRTDFSQKKTTIVLSGSLLNPANVQYVDESSGHTLFKRDSVKRDKRDNPEKDVIGEDAAHQTEERSKRGLVALADGAIVDETYLAQDNLKITSSDFDEALLQQSLLDGLAGFDGNVPVQEAQKEQVDEREPAEAEVKAVMDICSSCTPEPFKKALVLSWKTTGKKLYGGAYYYKGLPICKAF